jgi:hypothetical protein
MLNVSKRTFRLALDTVKRGSHLVHVDTTRDLPQSIITAPLLQADQTAPTVGHDILEAVITPSVNLDDDSAASLVVGSTVFIMIN